MSVSPRCTVGKTNKRTNENTLFKIPKTNGQIYQFVKINDRLYTGSGFMGFMEIKDKDYEMIRESVNYDFRVQALYHSLIDTNRLYVAVQGGVASFYFDKNELIP